MLLDPLYYIVDGLIVVLVYLVFRLRRAHHYLGQRKSSYE